jgi:hypothetical protein
LLFISGSEARGWATLFLLGAYHGVNPGMGWLFAVALGMQEKSPRAVIRSLAPIALGHAFAIGAAVLLAGLAHAVLPLNYVKIAVAAALVGLGLYRIIRSRHLRWSRMQVGFRGLTAWSFLMASAHGAGLMALPVVMHLTAGRHTHAGMQGIQATLIHTAGYLAVTAIVALTVYQKLGLALLRTAWLNLDLVWAVALIATGCIAMFV